MEEIRRAGRRGTTAREISKRLKIDHLRVVNECIALFRHRKIIQEWVACADWKTHYAVQESRYWLTGVTPNAED